MPDLKGLCSLGEHNPGILAGIIPLFIQMFIFENNFQGKSYRA